VKINVSKEAAQWFIEELDLKENDSIKFYGKVYGPFDGFSIGMDKVEPSKAEVMVTVEGVNFYVEQNDAWFFDNQDLNVTYDNDRKEVSYQFIDR